MELKIEYKKTEELIPYVMNARVHSDQQVAQIASSIKEFGFNAPIAIDSDNGVICGHGRLLAAKKLGITEVPTVCLSHLSPIQKKAYILADNKLSLNASWDENVLKLELEDLKVNNFKIDNFGFDSNEISKILENDTRSIGVSDNKSNEAESLLNLKSPVYEPKGPMPSLAELYDSKKTDSLISEINQANIPEDLKKFLRCAAGRHCQFNYEKIAEYYAHCDGDIQKLFENSALVIVDINDAIHNGFVKMSQKLEQIIKDQQEANGDQL